MCDSKSSDKLVHLPRMMRVQFYLSLDSPEAVEARVISNESDQTAQMHGLISVFAGRASLIVVCFFLSCAAHFSKDILFTQPNILFTQLNLSCSDNLISCSDNSILFRPQYPVCKT